MFIYLFLSKHSATDYKVFRCYKTNKYQSIIIDLQRVITSNFTSYSKIVEPIIGSNFFTMFKNESFTIKPTLFPCFPLFDPL